MGSQLGKALDYAKKHLPGLKNVLLDGSLETIIIMLLKELSNLLILEEKTSYLLILLKVQQLVLSYTAL